MKSLKKLLLTKSLIAAAIATSGIAAPVVSHAIVASSPSAGVFCRAGYLAGFDGTRLRCTKTVDITVALECLDSRFATYLIRAVVPPTGVGRDFCLRQGFVLSSTDSIANAVLGQDYVLAEVNPATVTTRTASQRQTEATTLGVALSEVATVASVPVIQLGGASGNKDNAKVTLTHFTYAIQAPGGIVVGNPGPLTSATPFVPRALP